LDKGGIEDIEDGYRNVMMLRFDFNLTNCQVLGFTRSASNFWQKKNCPHENFKLWKINVKIFLRNASFITVLTD
jgi:hypothetical protein